MSQYVLKNIKRFATSVIRDHLNGNRGLGVKWGHASQHRQRGEETDALLTADCVHFRRGSSASPPGSALGVSLPFMSPPPP
ncbi:hypothetical protein Pcinc_041588 [Petrolisthes cinctipes]|uniref:Uncharacterized protein n=1 Tax=Petrolisthes cinctipes TaxID=88211 RepID=A0AAE1BMX4_PETCI|nr:hypothetical protein Pcinc_041588 [Petrolisthes cinctipes]